MKKICFVLTLFVVSLSLLTTPAYAIVYSYTSGNTTVKYNSTTYVLTISAKSATDGRMADYDALSSKNEDKAPWTNYMSSIKTIDIEEGVTYIGTYSFYSASAATRINIPVSLTNIGQKAFTGCSHMADIYYASTPDNWVSINFQSSQTTDASANPFYASNSTYAPTRSIHFYGKDDPTSDVVLTSAITKINSFAFYKANGITNIYIPGTVTSIGNYALYCELTTLTINKQTPPTLGTSSINFKDLNSTVLYLREDAATSYKTTPWYNGTTNKTGAYAIGTSGDNANIKGPALNSTGNTYKVSGTMNSINWALDEQGTLTLEGNGSITTSYNGSSYSNANILPWARFRRLVNKVVIKANGGDITALNNALQYNYAITDISIEQSTIPTATYSVDYTFKSATDNVNLLVKANVTTINNAKANATWSASNIRLGLNENVVLDEASDNEALLNAINAHIGLPFTAELDRSLKSVSFNSFCSPVPMTSEQVQSVFGAGTEIYTLATSNYNESENTLYINLSENQTAIEAGKPYIIKPANDEPAITINNINPEDIATAGQTISTDAIDFHGLINPYTLVPGDKFLVVSANNELNWTTSGTMKGMRSYFTLKSGIPARALSARASFVFPNNSPEAVNNVSNAQQPIQKVMRNGQLVIIRDGVTYNTMGQVIE